MRLSEYPIQSLKEVPADAEIVSHRLMLRAGLIRRLAGGLYTWLPMGLRVLRKVERVIREEMDRAGALEIVMPVAQPAELWVESGRWDKFGPELLRFKDRHDRDMVLGPDARGGRHRHRTSRAQELPPAAGQPLPDPDEVPRRDPSALRRHARARVRHEGRLPAFMSTKPRSPRAIAGCTTPTAPSSPGWACDSARCTADSGAIGGSASQEFHVLADSGEDAIVFSDGDGYAANLELAEALPPRELRAAPSAPMREVATPGARTIADVAKLLSLPASRLLKTLVVEGTDGGLRRPAAARRPRAERAEGKQAAGPSRSRCGWPTLRASPRHSAASPASSGPWASSSR
jgi:prolyl-tRNA synthetase